jgi:hypothetical protein
MTLPYLWVERLSSARCRARPGAGSRECRTRPEHLVPSDAGGHLHQGEQRDDGADRDGQARVPLDEEGIAEEWS